MSTAHRIVIALAALLAVAMGAAAMGLWPLVRRTDPAYIEYVQRDVEFGWLLLQAAMPLFAMSAMTGLVAAVLALRFAFPRATPRALQDHR